MDRGENKDPNNSTYALLVMLTVLLFLFIPATFVAVIDPYQLINTPAIADLNERKTGIFFHLTTSKSYQFHRSNHNNLILGTSRAGHAIDPDHPTLRDRQFYNFATPGSQPGLDRRKLEAALNRGRVDEVIFFVDFFAFNTIASFPQDFVMGFQDRLSLSSSAFASPVFLRQALYDFSSYFWSYQSIRDSVTTMRQQPAANAQEVQFTSLHENGRWDISYSKDRQTLEAFKQVERSYLSGNWFPAHDPRFSLTERADASNRAFTEFEKTLKLAYENNVEMKIVMLPVHARLLENLDYAGLWQHMEAWKRRLVYINESAAAENSEEAFVIWDFNGYNPISMELVADDTQTKDLQWMKDSAHVSKAAGDFILDIVFERVETRFGGKLSSNNIDTWLTTQRDLQDQYRTAHPGVAKKIKKQVKRFRNRNPWEVVPLSE